MEAGALRSTSVDPSPVPFEAALSRARHLIEAELRRALAGEDGPVAQAMLYACEGGKGLRGLLVLESARLHGLPEAHATPVAAAIEALHAYSLIHDDLPCMDDDDLRRGRPTVHRKWDEATAVLAGDALQALAFELVAQAPLLAEARASLVLTLAQASGIRGMVGGQALDIAAETAPAPLTLDQVTALQARKTGALITWSAAAGARMAGADPAPLLAYGDALGLAFQIADDLLDVEGDATEVGKATGKDADRGKATFVSLLGLDAARARANSLVQDACDALAPHGAEADTLREAARFVTSRRK
jgi:farnesyl diphosphate synthase